MASDSSLYLSQARSFLRQGDVTRALELLERARVLCGADATLLRAILLELSGACQAAGALDRASRYQQMAESLPVTTVPPPPAPATPSHPGYAAGAFAPQVGLATSPPRARPSNRRVGRHVAIAGACAIAGLLAIGGVIAAWHFAGAFSESTAFEGTPVGVTHHPTTTTAPAAPLSSKAATPLAARPVGLASPGTASATAAPGAARLQAPATPVATPAGQEVSLGQLMKESVGQVFVMARYEQIFRGETYTAIIPLSSGSAFAIPGKEDGLMLTNRHVIDWHDIPSIPKSLPFTDTVSLERTRIYLLVCLGPNTADHFEADVVHSSVNYDMALIRVKGHRFEHPLKLSPTPPELGDPIYACGYPGIACQLLDKDAARDAEFRKSSWQARTYDFLLLKYPPDSFFPTLTNGIVGNVGRRIEGAIYLQTNTVINHGNSGGPFLNARHEAFGIATLGTKGSEQWNFALRIDQLMDELRPYLKGE